jgi:hypothetical protein
MPTTLTRKPLNQRDGARTTSKRPSGLSRGSTPSTTRTHAASARRRSHNSFVRPPPIHWRADRHRGRLDQPESAQPRLAIALSIRLPSQGWEARSRWCRS